MNNKGSFRDVLLIAVLMFVFGIGFLIMHYAGGQITGNLLNNTAVNASPAAVQVLQNTATTTDKADYLIFSLFIGLILGLIITGWMVGSNPIFMMVYFLGVVMAVIFSTILSNTWEQVSQLALFASDITKFPITNNILINLPIYISIIGFLGMIVMFAKPYLSGNSGGEY